MSQNNLHIRHLIARLFILLVFASNMYCSISFIISPFDYVSAYQLEGPGSEAAIAGLGVAFAMWNVTYVPISVFPYKFRAIFIIVIIQQIIGLGGELWIYGGLGASQAILAASIMRFVIFDAIGLVLLVIAFIISRK